MCPKPSDAITVTDGECPWPRILIVSSILQQVTIKLFRIDHRPGHQYGPVGSTTIGQRTRITELLLQQRSYTAAGSGTTHSSAAMVEYRSDIIDSKRRRQYR